MSGIFRHAFIPPPIAPVILSYASDILAPTLLSPLGTETGLTTADGTVSTNDSTGTLYWVVTDNVTSPSVAQIQAGQDHTGAAADASGSQAVVGLGTQTVNGTGITTGAARYYHFQQQDGATNDSTVVSSASFILQAPTLSSPTATIAGVGTVSTDESGGTWYWVVTQSATGPSVAQVQAGQDHLGAAADDSGSAAVVATGVQTANSSGLVDGTTYYFHFQQEDAAANDSTVASSASFEYTLTTDTNPETVEKVVLRDIMRDIMKGPSSASTPAQQSGLVWAAQTSGTSEILRSIAYDGTSRWVACGDNGTILTSDDDGVTWVARVSGVSTSLRTVKYWGGNWYIVGWGTASTHTVRKSADGTTWAGVSIPGLTGGHLVTIGFTDTYLMFGGWEDPFDASSALIVTSEDGTTFVANTHSTFAAVYSIENDGETVVVSGSDAADDSVPYIATTADGGATLVDITSIGSDFTWSIYASCFNGSYWVFVDGNGNTKYSLDGLVSLEDSIAPDIASQTPWRIVDDPYGTMILAGGTTSDAKLLRSIDNGVSFYETYVNATINQMSKAVYGNGYWLAVGFGGVIVKSS